MSRAKRLQAAAKLRADRAMWIDKAQRACAQSRKASHALAQSTGEITSYRMREQQAIREMANIQTTHRRLLEMLPFDSVARAEPNNYARIHMYRGQHNFHFEPHSLSLKPYSGNSEVEHTWKTQRLLMHVLNVSAVHEQFKRMIHVRVSLADGEAGYAISEETLRYSSAEQIAELISDELGKCLAQHLKNPGSDHSLRRRY